MAASSLIKIGNEPVVYLLSTQESIGFTERQAIESDLEGELLALDGETAPFYVDRPVTV
ncbi:hypothetical protein ACK36M_07890 [Aeromonas veronii]